MKKYSDALFFTLFFLIQSVHSFAQMSNETTVYLKNGSIVHGFITEYRPDVSVTVKTTDGNIIVAEWKEIEKFTWGTIESTDAPKNKTAP